MGKIEPTFSVLVVIDLANSTKYIEKVGDRRAAETFKLYDRIFRGLLIKHNGIEIDKTDGALLLFESIKDAVKYSLEYHTLTEKHIGLYSRVGIHCGTVMMYSNSVIWVSRGAKPIEVEGIQKSICARVCSLADPGQTLMTKRTAQVSMSHAATFKGIGIRNVGVFLFKGVKKPMVIYAIANSADKERLRTPSSKDKAKLFKKPPLSKKEIRIQRFKRYVLPYLIFRFVQLVIIGLSILDFPENKHGFIDWYNWYEEIVKQFHSLFNPKTWFDLFSSFF